jgi:formamidopyrimidine-DNA glycosylase
MPELPEVETVARTLREGRGVPALLGRTIEAVRVLWPREIHGLSVDAFSAAITGARVAEVGRVGKYLTITLGGADGARRTMLVHLRMSGRLDVHPRAEAMTRHARVVWDLDQDLALTFDDARKFGRVYLPNHIDDVLGKLGPDALQISEDAFVERLAAKRGALKSVLLDQHFIAGVGNIYADESLHRAALHPTRSAATVKPAAARALHAVIRDVLHEGIAANGASFDWVYPDGNFQENFRVYGQTGKPCPRCGAPIQRIVVGQRSTHFCKQCQR